MFMFPTQDECIHVSSLPFGTFRPLSEAKIPWFLLKTILTSPKLEMFVILGYVRRR